MGLKSMVVRHQRKPDLPVPSADPALYRVGQASSLLGMPSEILTLIASHCIFDGREHLPYKNPSFGTSFSGICGNLQSIHSYVLYKQLPWVCVHLQGHRDSIELMQPLRALPSTLVSESRIRPVMVVRGLKDRDLLDKENYIRFFVPVISCYTADLFAKISSGTWRLNVYFDDRIRRAISTRT
ncbi:hypothetical protein OHC33_003703 [Knufia fluminis]|uniref:Uncharacterized protein n=1 Tax=Knufia fluminis TaxID=191047 RepID=A0AAN8I6T8_9EURO|nr:hypothetical protein OHC33_003703 [Knufia fluminis]